MSKNDWPQKGDQYWYVNWEYGTASSLLVRSSTYDGVDIDKNRRVIGNCYRTEQTANLCHEVSILQDGQLELSPELTHVPIPHYMPDDINNPSIPINRDYNDGVINIRQWTSSAE